MLTKSHLTFGTSQRFLYLLHRHISSDSIRKHDDDNYFKRSILPTDHFQYSLPRLPIPKLELTCERYLSALKPILNDDEKAFDQTRQIVDDFRSGDGKRLDAQLRQKNLVNRYTSYISKPWFEMYLKSRLPLILNFNFFLVFTDDQKQLKPAARITNYIISSVRFMNSLRTNSLDPEVYHLNPKKTNTDRFRKYLRYVPKLLSFYGAALQKAYPLDMSQYSRLFNSTRIPKPDCDILVSNTDNIRHIIVIKGGHYYKVNILEKNGQLFSAAKIAAIMKYLSEDLNEEENKYPLGYFTADKRDRWALIRQQIEALSEHNKQMLKEIDSSIMVICLDDDDPSKFNKSLTKGQRAEYVAGKYLCYNALNRWYDKSFNMIMSSDGTLGLHCEHSWGDGVALIRFCNDIDKDANEHGKINSSNYPTIQSSTHDCIEKLQFQLDDKLKNEFQVSKGNYDEFVAKFHVNVYQEPVLGKNLLKKSALSPDAIMQLGIQMAYYKMHHRFVSTYESCSTAVYKHGRTETIRPVTNETKNFIETLTKSNDAQLKKDLLKKSSEKHQQLIKEAATGQGFDRHLFALKYLQQIENQETKLHPIYTDKSYQSMNHTILSTSTVASKHIAGGGFGPVVNDGFGIGYLIDDDQCGLLVTSYMEKELPDFVQAANDSYKELANIIKA
jgi:carnitine O-palmitoyltransferase 2